MTNFIVSARKYRPENFQSVVGQKSITTTLKNSIAENHLAHAYLFCGPRGVGKTTCARIFAKTINCQNPTEDHEACNTCESCVAFNESRSYNIHELDAASNNSVEDIRNLIEQVRIPPQIGSHSIYIIDEVHMLSSSAFNAFLKTLEEPPAHAVFVLATTEKHKILPTILSRCQIFDFNRISVDDAAEHLAYVAKEEGIETEPEALNAIAVKADGAMRDALSFFDQIVSFSGKKITYQNAIDNLNVLDFEYYFKLVDAFLENNAQESLLIFNTILNKGFDSHHFISGLSSHLRDLLVVKDPKTIELFETGEAIKKRYLEQAEKCSPRFLFEALKISNKADISYRGAQNKRLLTEICLLELANLTEEMNRPVNTTANTVLEKKQKPPENNPDTTTTKEKKTVNKKPAGKTSGIKLDPIVKTPEKTSAETQKPPANFEQAWINLASKFEKAPRLKAILSANVPTFENNNIIMTVSHKLQKEKLESLKGKIITFLRSELNINDLEMRINIDKENSDDRPYTQKDKYEFLAKKNENLNRLKDELDLDQ
jgi:DNA polymerase-3 subunit gamma/tau